MTQKIIRQEFIGNTKIDELKTDESGNVVDASSIIPTAELPARQVYDSSVSVADESGFFLASELDSVLKTFASR